MCDRVRISWASCCLFADVVAFCVYNNKLIKHYTRTAALVDTRTVFAVWLKKYLINIVILMLFCAVLCEMLWSP